MTKHFDPSILHYKVKVEQVSVRERTEKETFGDDRQYWQDDTEIFEQSVNDLDLQAVIAAVNGQQKTEITKAAAMIREMGTYLKSSDNEVYPAQYALFYAAMELVEQLEKGVPENEM